MRSPVGAYKLRRVVAVPRTSGRSRRQSDLGRRAYVRAHAISKGPEAVVRDHLDSIISAVFLCNVAILANTRLRSPLRASRSPHKATTPGVVAAVKCESRLHTKCITLRGCRPAVPGHPVTEQQAREL